MPPEPALLELAARYVWWQPPEVTLGRPHHFLCQLMTLGTAEDVRAARRALGDPALVDALEHAARALFGAGFNPLVAQKALAYFEGGDLASLPEGVKRRLAAEAIRDVEVRALAKTSGRLEDTSPVEGAPGRAGD